MYDWMNFIDEFSYARLSVGWHFLQDLISFIQAAVMEQYMFGIVILVSPQG